MNNSFLSTDLLAAMPQKLRNQHHKPGLYVVATPIGNLFDISIRALYILKSAKCVFAEDTRQSRKLLNFYDIKAALISCHEYNEDSTSITSTIKSGEIYALISDAGTPLISDPGYRIVNWCISNEIDVFPVPGACAFIAGLSAAGLPTDCFAFFGFLPSRLRARKLRLKEIEAVESTIIFLEAPNRVLDTLKNMLEILGDRYCCVCREITKIFEEFKRGKISDLIKHFSENKCVGEFVIIVSGNKNADVDEYGIFLDLSNLLKVETLKNAVKTISEKYNVPRSSVYKSALEIKYKTHD